MAVRCARLSVIMRWFGAGGGGRGGKCRLRGEEDLRAVGDTGIDHPEAIYRVKHDVLHIDETNGGVLALGTVLPFLRRPRDLLSERDGLRQGVVLLLHVPRVGEEDVVLGVHRDTSWGYGTLMNSLWHIANDLKVTRAYSDRVGVVTGQRVRHGAVRRRGR